MERNKTKKYIEIKSKGKKEEKEERGLSVKSFERHADKSILRAPVCECVSVCVCVCVAIS